MKGHITEPISKDINRVVEIELKPDIELRDVFAVAVAASSQLTQEDVDKLYSCKAWAEGVYRAADALVAARERTRE